ncbi:MAG: hypothetical protein PT934_01645 [Peptoniphilaceae bacterium]|uniref:hypothetical protein n=1 Tax=Parvimonas sp. TaxID=1944660 RepID=UPI002A759204|nr:hypothetical protein [Parvimonas sp.]MDD7764452.1 hypothetical protein [Peptoniphilaceae bacterium]MDY3051147.1 hypothetical protein [Parvimonas sp.]
MEILRINYFLFRKRLKLTKIRHLFFISSLIFLLLFVQLIFYKLGKYEQMYKLKFIIFSVFSAGTVFPSKNFTDLLRLKTFFNKINNYSLERYFYCKNYILTVILFVYFFIPYKVEFVKTFLLYFFIILFIYLIFIILSNLMPNNYLEIYLKIFRMIFAWGLFLYSDKILKFDFSYYANKLSIYIYVPLILSVIGLSLYFLKNIRSYETKNQKYLSLFVKNNKLFDYNLLYILRNKSFYNFIVTFYISMFLIFDAENVKNISFSIGLILILNNLYNFYSVWNFDEKRLNIFFSKENINSIQRLKNISIVKAYLIFVIAVFPIIFYRVGMVRAFLILIGNLLGVFVSNIIVGRFLKVNNFILNKNLMFNYFLINLIISILLLLFI